MLRMVDQLRSQKSYRRASAILVKAYLRLHDERPKGGGADGGGLPDMSNMSAAEKKKVKAKVKSCSAVSERERRGDGMAPLEVNECVCPGVRLYHSRA